MKNQTKIACILWAVMAIVCGCKKNEIQNVSSVKGKSSLSAIDSKFNLLGYGYDLTGEYANPESAGFQVIDIEKLAKDYPDRVELIPAVRQYSTADAGSNVVDWSQDMSSKVTGATDFKLFGGTAYGSFKTAKKASDRYSYAHISLLIRQKFTKLNASNDLIISNYLSPAFKSDLNSLTPQQLVKIYGTHVLTNIMLGAKLEFSYRSVSNHSDKKTAVTAGAAAHGLVKFFSVSTDFTYDDSLAKTNTEETISYQTIGGDGTRGLQGEVDLTKPVDKVNIGNWQSTCTMANATLIDIVKDGITPLYDLVSDPVKKEALKLYINQYLKDHEVRPLGDVPVYAYRNSTNGDRYFTPEDKPFIGNDVNFRKEGIAFYAFAKPTEGAVPIFAYRNSANRDRYFTPEDKPFIGNDPNFRKEGIAFYAYSKPIGGATPVYVYRNSTNGDRYFTSEDKPFIGNDPNFRKEGTAFYGVM